MGLAGQRNGSQKEEACKSSFPPPGASETFIQRTQTNTKHSLHTVTTLLTSCPHRAIDWCAVKVWNIWSQQVRTHNVRLCVQQARFTIKSTNCCDWSSNDWQINQLVERQKTLCNYFDNQLIIWFTFQGKMPNICWYRLLKREYFLLFLFYIVVSWISLDFGLLVEQRRHLETLPDAMKLWWAFFINWLIEKIVGRWKKSVLAALVAWSYGFILKKWRKKIT